MKEKLQKLNENNYSENDSAVIAKEKFLILLETKPNENLDPKINNPDRYVRW